MLVRDTVEKVETMKAREKCNLNLYMMMDLFNKLFLSWYIHSSNTQRTEILITVPMLKGDH